MLFIKCLCKIVIQTTNDEYFMAVWSKHMIIHKKPIKFNYITIRKYLVSHIVYTLIWHIYVNTFTGCSL